MGRLIDANKMIKDIKENYVIYGYADFLNDFFRMVEEQPTVDAVEVIRCKDCKYCDIGSYRGNCNLWDDGYGALVSMDDFCSQGERRKDETDSQEQLSKLQLSKL